MTLGTPVVAALYVDPRGPYPSLPGCDVWCEDRDATRYTGPYPVVAHPPCGMWGNYHAVCKYGGRECGPIAVAQVRRFGGVLEHPAHSALWRACGLPPPGGQLDLAGGFTLFVDQLWWGHLASKPTWLYVVGPASLRISLPAAGGTPRSTVENLSSRQRRLSPPLFAAWLHELASRCGGVA